MTTTASKKRRKIIAFMERALEREHEAYRASGEMEKARKVARCQATVNTRLTSTFGRFRLPNGRPPRVEVAGWLVKDGSWEKQKDTALHEVAHLIAWVEHGPGVGHDRRWKRIARRVGAEPTRCGPAHEWKHSPSAKRGPKWEGCCDCRVWHRKRLSRRARRGICPDCRNGIEWTQLR